MDGRWPSSGQRTTDIGQRMNINRHNYEEYFILYMDNELSSDDSRMVEEFVALHPDLKEELDLLLQYKLSPDTEILFPGKEELLKVNGETPITLSNYEDWLVLYTDNELNAEQKIEVEKFIQTNPEVQKELTLIQRTKLHPEQIVFENKESLFRKEEKVRLLPAHWWRVAAAVLLLIGLGITTAVIVNNRTTGGKDIVKGTETEKKLIPENPVIAPVQKEKIPVNEIVVTDNVNQVSAPMVKQNNKNNVVKDKLPENIPSPVKKDEHVIVDNNNKPSNNLPQPNNNPIINKNNATKADIANIISPEETNSTQKSLTSTTVTKKDVKTSPPENTDIGYAKLEEGGTNKKNRGFFRKLVRTFEKRTNMTATDDDRLLVGGLSIKLK
jgi:hypothetical protein